MFSLKRLLPIHRHVCLFRRAGDQERGMCARHDFHRYRAKDAHTQGGVPAGTKSNQVCANPLRRLQDAGRLVGAGRLMTNSNLRLYTEAFICIRDEAAEAVEKGNLFLRRRLALRDVKEVERPTFVQCCVPKRDGLVAKQRKVCGGEHGVKRAGLRRCRR